MTLTGGSVFWILMALAVGAVVVFVERLLELRRAQIDVEDFVKGVVNVLERGNDEEALAICEDTAVPASGVVATAIRHRHGSARVLREAVDAQGRAETSRLERRLAALAVIGQVSPALGLLGTVIGFAKAVMAASAQALVTFPDLTAAAMEAIVSAALGLAVAIPVAVMYAILRVRTDRIVVELEAAASRIVGYISTKEAQAKESAGRAVREVPA